MFLGFKTRSDYRLEIKKLQKEKMNLENEIKILHSLINKNVFDTQIIQPKKDWVSLTPIVLLNPDEETTDVDTDNKATIVNYDKVNYYMYLSKKLTEGYTYLSINFIDGTIHYYLNNDMVGLKIDSNNRVYGSKILGLLMGYYNAKGEKMSLFFEKK